MRLSQLFFQTQRQTPAEAETRGYQLLLRAGFIAPAGSGIYTCLPLATRTLQNIKTLLRSEITRRGGQEIILPLVQPADFWQKSGRWYKPAEKALRFKDARRRDLVLSGSPLELLADVLRQVLRSHKQLPLLLYQFQTDWHTDTESFPHAGLLRARLSETLNVYSITRDEAACDAVYQDWIKYLTAFFERLNLPLLSFDSGESAAHSFIFPTPWGDEAYIHCPACGYVRPQKEAVFKKTPAKQQPALQLEKVPTPGAKTIKDLAEYLNITPQQTAKAVFMVATLPFAKADTENETTVERFVFAVVRGDMDVNEDKLMKVLGAFALRPATEAEIKAVGAVPGYASPVGLKDVQVIVDEAVTTSPNLVSGANDEGYHLLNVNYGRDYQADCVADITLASEGSICPLCGQALRLEYAVEIASLTKTGRYYSDLFESFFQGENGTSAPAWLAFYHLNLERLPACLAETGQDEHGLIWPLPAAPFQVHLVGLNGAEEAADALYADLTAAGLDVLYDDRNESPGVKFNDADLIGIPMRLTLGKRTLKENAVELKLRQSGNGELVPLTEIQTRLLTLIKQL